VTLFSMYVNCPRITAQTRRGEGILGG
jgi:hypothetical protein